MTGGRVWPTASGGMTMRDRMKAVAGGAMELVNRQCAFDRAIFMLGHMRSASTALSNVICSHPEVSGYGEAHLSYAEPAALGQLVVNQMRRGSWRRSAGHLFDKVLHSRYDRATDPRFFAAKAIFMVREPASTVRSVRVLFDRVGGNDYRTDRDAADYYRRRLEQLAELWTRFPSANRRRVLHDELTSAPDAVLAALSSFLALGTPLANRYDANRAATRAGAGDPLGSTRFTAIVRADRATSLTERPLDLTPAEQDALTASYAAFLAATG